MFCVRVTFWENASPNHTESAIRSSWSGWLSRCVTFACCGQGAGSASLQARYGAGIGGEPVKAKCLRVRVF